MPTAETRGRPQRIECVTDQHRVISLPGEDERIGRQFGRRLGRLRTAVPGGAKRDRSGDDRSLVRLQALCAPDEIECRLPVGGVLQPTGEPAHDASDIGQGAGLGSVVLGQFRSSRCSLQEADASFHPLVRPGHRRGTPPSGDCPAGGGCALGGGHVVRTRLAEQEPRVGEMTQGQPERIAGSQVACSRAGERCPQIVGDLAEPLLPRSVSNECLFQLGSRRGRPAQSKTLDPHLFAAVRQPLAGIGTNRVEHAPSARARFVGAGPAQHALVDQPADHVGDGAPV